MDCKLLSLTIRQSIRGSEFGSGGDDVICLQKIQETTEKRKTFGKRWGCLSLWQGKRSPEGKTAFTDKLVNEKREMTLMNDLNFSLWFSLSFPTGREWESGEKVSQMVSMAVLEAIKVNWKERVTTRMHSHVGSFPLMCHLRVSVIACRSVSLTRQEMAYQNKKTVGRKRQKTGTRKERLILSTVSTSDDDDDVIGNLKVGHNYTSYRETEQLLTWGWWCVTWINLRGQLFHCRLGVSPVSLFLSISGKSEILFHFTFLLCCLRNKNCIHLPDIFRLIMHTIFLDVS